MSLLDVILDIIKFEFIPFNRSINVCGNPSWANMAAQESSIEMVPTRMITSRTISSSATPVQKQAVRYNSVLIKIFSVCLLQRLQNTKVLFVTVGQKRLLFLNSKSVLSTYSKTCTAQSYRYTDYLSLK